MTIDERNKANTLLRLVFEELKSAKEKYPDQNSCHEGYAILIEEVDKLWSEIKNRNQDEVAIKDEATQVAAMAVRMILDLYKEEG